MEKLAKQNTPTPLACELKRTEAAIRKQASKNEISLKPTDKSPYGTDGKGEISAQMNVDKTIRIPFINYN